MSKVNMELRLQIYDCLINEFMFQCQIVERLNLTKQAVSRHVNAMLSNKLRIIEDAIPESHETYLKTVRNRGYHRPKDNIRSGKCKSYRRGPNAGEYDLMLKTGKIHTNAPQIRVHHTQYKMKLIKQYDNAKELSDNWEVVTVNDYVCNKYCEIPFEGYGNVKIRWTVSHKKNGPVKETIVVSLPPNIKYFKGEYGDLERGMKAFDIQQWFGRNGYKLSLPERIKDTHYGIDTGIESERFGVIPIDKDTYLDSSPGVTYEAETKKPMIANTLSELPGTISSIDRTLNNGFDTLIENNRIQNNRISGLIEFIKSNQEEDNKTLVNGLSELKNSFDGGIDKLISVLENQSKDNETIKKEIKESSKYVSKKTDENTGYQ